MSQEPPSPRISLGQRLVLILLLPLLILLALSVWIDYRIALRTANLAYDGALAEAASAVALRIRIDSGRVTVDANPPVAVLARSDDGFFFAVINPSGEFVAGDSGLLGAARPATGNPAFFDGRYRDQPIRGVAYKVQTAAGAATVLAAETTRKREQVARGVLATMVLPNFFLVATALVLVLFGVRFGLAPLLRLTGEIEQRSARDLRPLPVENIPREARPLADALNRLFALLAESATAQQRFLANAAHQLRTPLAGLQTQLELAADDGYRTIIQERLGELRLSVRRVSRLVQQMLALAKAEPASNLAIQPQLLDLKQVVEKSVSSFLDAALHKNIDLGFEPRHAPVRGMAWLIREMLANLVENAIHYTPAGGAVTVRCGLSGEVPYLEVEDNGPGIPPAERERVFERFYRMPGTSGEGCGLGLAIVREIADAHLATVKIETPASGQGTRITVAFPAPAPDQ